MEKIIDYEVDASGTYVPSSVVEEPKKKPNTRRRQRSHQPSQQEYHPLFIHPFEIAVFQRHSYYQSDPPRSSFDDFMIGIDAGMNIIENIAERLERFREEYGE